MLSPPPSPPCLYDYGCSLIGPMVHLQPPSPVYHLGVFPRRLLPQPAMGTEMPLELPFCL